MRIQQFRYSRDNLSYLIYTKNTGIAIDAGAVNEIIDFAEKNNIRIQYVTNTHKHYDHTPGNDAVLEKTGAEFIDVSVIKADTEISLSDKILEVMYTPGHTDDSVTFKADHFIVAGDTLFNGTVGNCFSGDLDAFFHSLKRLMALPGKTKVYAGHDYVKEAMMFARMIEKNNPDIDLFLNKYDPGHVVSFIEDERKVNPFLRFNAPFVYKALEEKKMDASTELDRFKAIMEIF